MADTVANAIELFLTSQVSPDKAPAQFDRALSIVCSSKPDETLERTLLQAGYHSWFGYFLATKLYLPVVQIPSEAFNAPGAIADRVAQIQPEPSIKQLTQHLFWTARRAPERRKLLETAGIPVPPNQALNDRSRDANPPSPKRPCLERRLISNSRSVDPRLSSGADSIVIHSTHNGQTMTRDRTQWQQPLSNRQPQAGPRIDATALNGAVPTERLETHPPDKNDFSQLPPAKTLLEVFPAHICRKVLKEHGKAFVGMTFPTNEAECCLTLTFPSEQAQRLAQQLFDVELAIVDGRRHIVHESDAHSEIQGSIKMKRAAAARIETYFGPTIAMGFSTSIPRAKEILDGQALSDCLCLEVGGKHEEPIRLTIMIHPMQLSVIQRKLWEN
ncbi:hypothetical protein JX265_012896 [Neoarthrinium moseri]|uniref:Uncharacterized protein n=1 Tax=Neoarthrinium moseri TaxID=1658444 RepID=A0A9P9WA07_9PEZI|nr:hypothetical protein JX265_012896 [Neoarthrinium moseri]